MDTRELKPQDGGEQENSGRGRSRADRGQGRNRLVIAAAAVIIIAAGIAIAAGSAAKHKAAEAESIAASLAAEAEADSTAADYELSEFEECNIPELNMLAQKYFEAKLKGDTDALAEIFGRAAVDSDAELATRLKAQADWIQTYTVNKVYTAKGLDDNARLCLVQYDIDFRRTDTLAPGVMYFYALRDSDGNYTVAENPVKDIHSYILAELETASAKNIIDDSNTRLKEALSADSTLALIYVSFRSGDIYKESDLDVNRDQEVGFTAEDSILVGDDVLADIQNEAEAEAAEQASLAAQDESEIDAAESADADASSESSSSSESSAADVQTAEAESAEAAQ